MKKILLISLMLFSQVQATVFKNTNVTLQDTEVRDAFGRLRVSQPFNVFDMQFNYDLQDLFFEESATGGGDVTHVANSSAARLTTGGVTDTHGVIFQTYQYFRYQPGKSQFVVFTCILGAKTSNVRKRIGQFDAANGFFFEQDASNLKIVRRTKTSGSIVDNAVNQSSWNLDILDGTGPSGKTLDETKDNIYVIDFQWLGAGRIRFGFDFGGQITYCHEIVYANTATVPFAVTGNLPFRAEIFNIATAAGTSTFDFTCVAVASEGGFNPLGIRHSINTGATGETLTTIEPVLSIRPKLLFNAIANRGQILPLTIDVLSTAEPIIVDVYLNTTLTGAAFASADADSTVEFDVAATAIAGGHLVTSFHVAGASQGNRLLPDSQSKSLMSKQTLNLNIAADTADILTIAATSLTGGATDVYVAVDWLELR